MTTLRPLLQALVLCLAPGLTATAAGAEALCVEHVVSLGGLGMGPGQRTFTEHLAFVARDRLLLIDDGRRRGVNVTRFGGRGRDYIDTPETGRVSLADAANNRVPVIRPLARGDPRRTRAGR